MTDTSKGLPMYMIMLFFIAGKNLVLLHTPPLSTMPYLSWVFPARIREGISQCIQHHGGDQQPQFSHAIHVN